MRTIIFFILLSISVYSEQQSDVKKIIGFEHIPFGIERDSFITKWNEIHGEADIIDNVSDNYGGSINDFPLSTFYDLGDRNFELSFWFTLSGLFYKYSFRSVEFTANEYKKGLNENVKYLSNIFQKRFGKPAHKYNPPILKIKEGYEHFYWKWVFTNCTVYTAITCDNYQYKALAVVYNDSLSKSQAILQENLMNRSILKAANQF